MFHLTVLTAFADRVRGDVITDADEIADALEHHGEKVMRVPADPETHAAKEG